MAEPRHYRPEWIQDYRKHRRWLDRRTALLHLDSDEHLAKTADISLGGMRLALHRVEPRPGTRVSGTVVFADAVRDFRGAVVYAKPEPWGCLVGIEFDPAESAMTAYLNQRYPPEVAEAFPA